MNEGLINIAISVKRDFEYLLSVNPQGVRSVFQKWGYNHEPTPYTMFLAMVEFGKPFMADLKGLSKKGSFVSYATGDAEATPPVDETNSWENILGIVDQLPKLVNSIASIFGWGTPTGQYDNSQMVIDNYQAQLEAAQRQQTTILIIAGVVCALFAFILLRK